MYRQLLMGCTIFTQRELGICIFYLIFSGRDGSKKERQEKSSVAPNRERVSFLFWIFFIRGVYGQLDI